MKQAILSRTVRVLYCKNVGNFQSVIHENSSSSLFVLLPTTIVFPLVDFSEATLLKKKIICGQFG